MTPAAFVDLKRTGSTFHQFYWESERMSFSEKDRKLQSKIGKAFPTTAAESLATSIALALREEFGSMPSAFKTVAQLTRSNERAVRNWFDGKNSPSAENLVVLMRHSDLILRSVLALADRQDLVVAAGLERLRRQLVDAVAAIDELPRGPSDSRKDNLNHDSGK